MSCFEMPVKELVSIRTVPCLRLSKAARAPEERRGLPAFAMRVRAVRVEFLFLQVVICRGRAGRSKETRSWLG